MTATRPSNSLLGAGRARTPTSAPGARLRPRLSRLALKRGAGPQQSELPLTGIRHFRVALPLGAGCLETLERFRTAGIRVHVMERGRSCWVLSGQAPYLQEPNPTTRT